MIYLYQCDKCKKRFEGNFKLKDSEKEVKCPRCKRVMKKLLSPLRFTFK